MIDKGRRYINNTNFIINKLTTIQLKYTFICFLTGHGVFTTIAFSKGDFLLEYAGDKIYDDEAEQREKVYR
jgi:hypothetical protein